LERESERDLESRILSLLIELIRQITKHGGRNHGVGHLRHKTAKTKGEEKRRNGQIAIP
jgi:hypothetical protein